MQLRGCAHARTWCNYQVGYHDGGAGSTTLALYQGTAASPQRALAVPLSFSFQEMGRVPKGRQNL